MYSGIHDPLIYSTLADDHHDAGSITYRIVEVLVEVKSVYIAGVEAVCC
jgi:hypothetical protein